MKNILKRLGRTFVDLLTSKKALAAGVALASGVDPKVVLVTYLGAQSIDDHGQGPKDKDGNRLGKSGKPAPVPGPF